MGPVRPEAAEGECTRCPVHRLAFCSTCTPVALAPFENLKFYRRFGRGDTIFSCGEPTEFVATIVTGVATLSRALPDGRCQMVGLMMPSDFLGHPDQERARYDVTALTPITLCCMPRKKFRQQMERSPQATARLFEMKRDELEAIQQWLVLLGRKNAREKVASLLLTLLRHDHADEPWDEGQPVTLELWLNGEEMGNYLGLSVETVSRSISSLRRDGVILGDGTRVVSIPSVERLSIEACDESVAL